MSSIKFIVSLIIGVFPNHTKTPCDNSSGVSDVQSYR
jgi:hypothetical protein